MALLVEPAPEATTLERILRRDRAVVATALTLITALSWIYLVDMAIDMGMFVSGEADSAMEGSGTKGEGSKSKSKAGVVARMAESMEGGGTAIAGISSWSLDYFVMMFLMWAIMMVGMMVPTAAPMILIYAQFARNRQRAGPLVSTGAFVTGYLIVWTGFSLAATIAQWGLDEAALLSPMMVSTSPWLGAGLLIAAGVFQLTPWKNACLAHCRTPFQFFTEHWRIGRLGALRMGLHHGWYCLGCCWALMLLLFFGGVMNLLWIAAITVFVLLEKVLPRGPIAGRVSGVAMIALGVVVFAAGAA